MFGDKSEFIDGDLEKVYREGLLNLDKVFLDEEIDRSSLIPARKLSAFLVADPSKKQVVPDLLIECDRDGEFNDFVEEDPQKRQGRPRLRFLKSGFY